MVGELQRDQRGRVLRVQIILFLFSLAVFLSAPVIEVSDSRYAALLSESLWRHHTAELDEYYKVPVPDPTFDPNRPGEANEYQLVQARGHVTYFYPHATSILSIPLVAAINAAGVSAATPDHRLNLAGEIRIERAVAAVLMAGMTCLFFATAAMMLPLSWSIVVALGASFGTQILSTASRGLWSHDWELFLYGLIAYSILSTEHRGAGLRPVWLGTLVAWSYFVRPTGMVAIIAVSAYVLWVHRKEIIAYAVTLAGWMVAFVAYWWSVFGLILPRYFRAARMYSENLAGGLAGNLISSSRGEFVYVPTTLFVLYLVARYRKHLAHRPLAVLALAQIVGLAMIISNFFWVAVGYCYGPRYFTDAIPWFVLLAILGLDAMRSAKDAQRYRMEVAAAIFLLAVSVAMNARGAWSYVALDWSLSDYALHQTSVFDWRYPQFMAGLIAPPKN